jgi:ubiquinone/menaquinone biosynthesis C-methylase UbiE
MRSLPRAKVEKTPHYIGSEWDRVISNPDHPNFWKFGVADLVFLESVGDRKFVLDLGCGTGGSTLLLASRGRMQWIVGVDLMSDMVKVAKKKAAEKGLEGKVCFVVCDGRRLPFRSSFFDGLVSRGDAFCFLVPLKTTVQELKKVMKPGGVIVLEMDNRVNWKPGTTISAGFQKTTDGRIAYLVTTFTKKRNYNSVSYFLSPDGKMAKKIAGDPEFQQKGYKPSRSSIQKVKEESIEIRRAAPTSWPSRKGLTGLFKKGGFVKVQMIGDGLFMNLLLERDNTIVEEMKKNPQLFFKIEKRLVHYVNVDRAPTMILVATTP